MLGDKPESILASLNAQANHTAQARWYSQDRVMTSCSTQVL